MVSVGSLAVKVSERTVAGGGDVALRGRGILFVF